MTRILKVLNLLILTGIAGISGAETLTGRLDVVWGDGRPGSGLAPTAWVLAADDGQRERVAIDDTLLHSAGGTSRVDDRRVRLVVERTDDGAPVATALKVLDERPDPREVTGSQPWVSLLCRFSDYAAEPRDVTYFERMFGSDPGALDHFWRTTSGGAIDLTGSTVSDWRPLPHPRAYYAPAGGFPDLTALFEDCTTAHDPVVDFSNGDGHGYAGISLMFNADIGCCAWGGSFWAELDGIAQSWRTTWEPPWGWSEAGALAHEMGHGFGLPHSNNWDNDADPYDNSWDVMSDVWNWSISDPHLGTLPKHTIAAHKDLLGWIPPDERLVVERAGAWTVVLDDLALASTSALRVIVVPVPGSSRSWYVESRRRGDRYDGALPGDAVIIHEADPDRVDRAWAFDEWVPPASTSSSEGSMWRPGETFEDPSIGLTITVESATADGFWVRVVMGVSGVVFEDGMESGCTSGWSATHP